MNKKTSWLKKNRNDQSNSRQFGRPCFVHIRLFQQWQSNKRNVDNMALEDSLVINNKLINIYAVEFCTVFRSWHIQYFLQGTNVIV